MYGIYRHHVKCVLVRGNLINVEFYGLDDLPPRGPVFVHTKDDGERSVAFIEGGDN